MLARLASLRLWLLIAMIVSAAAGLVGAAFLFTQVENSHESTTDRTQARQEARTEAAGAARAVRRRFTLYKMLVRLASLSAAVALAVWLGWPRV